MTILIALFYGQFSEAWKYRTRRPHQRVTKLTNVS